MALRTLADWERVGTDEVRWRLTMTDPPATFAECRHYASWMRMFRLFLLSHEPTEHLEFLDAVDELRLWEPHTSMTRRVYDLYVSSEQEHAQKKIHFSGPIRGALRDAFAAVQPPDRADVFRAAYEEVVLLLNEGMYRDFKEMAAQVRATPGLEEDTGRKDRGARRASRVRTARRPRRVPGSVTGVTVT